MRETYVFEPIVGSDCYRMFHPRITTLNDNIKTFCTLIWVSKGAYIFGHTGAFVTLRASSIGQTDAVVVG